MASAADTTPAPAPHLALATLGRAITILYGVSVAASAIAVLAHTSPGQWIVLLPYLALEFGVTAVVFGSPAPVAWAESVWDVVVPLVTTFGYATVVWLAKPATTTWALEPVGRLLLLGAYAWGAWSIAHLRGNFSVLPEARGFVRTGPYGIVRHPLYLAYLGTMAAGALIDRSPALLVGTAVWAVLFWWRAELEERKLRTVFGEYGPYARVTGRLLPRPWIPAGMPREGESVWVTRADGTVLGRVRTLRRLGSRMRGLLGTDHLAAGSGVLLLPCRAVHTRAMRYPIDVVFLDATGRVVRILREMVPGRRMAWPAWGSLMCLEMPAASAGALQEGETLSLSAAAPKG